MAAQAARHGLRPMRLGRSELSEARDRPRTSPRALAPGVHARPEPVRIVEQCAPDNLSYDERAAEFPAAAGHPGQITPGDPQALGALHGVDRELLVERRQ